MARVTVAQLEARIQELEDALSIHVKIDHQPQRSVAPVRHTQKRCSICYKEGCDVSKHSLCPECYAPEGKSHGMVWVAGEHVLCSYSQ